MAASQKLYTLTELSQVTGISMPTLQRYKEKYKSRIPSLVEGRTELYPQQAVVEIKKIHKENVEDDAAHAEL